jgi:hypothetical protein
VFSAPAKFERVTTHRAELPEPIAHWLYDPFASTSTPILLDPFMGSGTLLLPAVRANCPAIGIEIDEAHCEAAAKRLAGAKPEQRGYGWACENLGMPPPELPDLEDYKLSSWLHAESHERGGTDPELCDVDDCPHWPTVDRSPADRDKAS